MTTDLSSVAKEKGLRYFLISFVDLFGVMRAKLVPASAIAAMQAGGAGFAGFATHLDMTPADPDMFAIPDPGSLTITPWKKDVGWLAADLYTNDVPVAQAPRWVLKRQMEAAAKAGFLPKTGVEAEYFLITPDGEAISDPADLQAKPCYDQQALMRRSEVIMAVCDAMQELGWGPYQNDHEDANGQFEMNWDYSEALVTADRHAFFKSLVKTTAEAHGLRSTFMPKPFDRLTGNGCHTHVSFWTPDGKTNVFADSKGELGLSQTAYHFLGGIMHHAPALCALLAPTVNSYKRLNAAVTRSGATWSPNTISYGGNNRTHMVRIPDAGRFEIRLGDGAANPYLLQAGLIAAGLDGIAKGRDPGKRLDIDMYTEAHKAPEIKTLPFNLLDALRALEESAVLTEALGADFVAAYIKLKTESWREYTAQLTAWERKTTLDC